jgi:DNA-binding beta-propeller fold protein YncE
VAELFVTNVLNGTVAAGGALVNQGTVLRLLVTTPNHGLPRLLAVATIGSGFPERTDKNALVIGPTGVGLGRDGTLYVADTLNNRIAAIRHAVFRWTTAGTGQTVSQNGALNGPLGLAIAPGNTVARMAGFASQPCGATATGGAGKSGKLTQPAS